MQDQHLYESYFLLLKKKEVNYYKDGDNTFKKSEHIRRQLLQSFDFYLVVFQNNGLLS